MYGSIFYNGCILYNGMVSIIDENEQCISNGKQQHKCRHGDCIRGNTTYQCRCKIGWEGEFCDGR